MRTKSENPLPKTMAGAVCAQMTRCGKPNCKCVRGELHGPYFYHFKRVNGVLMKRYVKKKDAYRMRAACEARRRMEKRDRSAHKLTVRQLAKLIEQLRGNERLLLKFMEVQRGKTKEEG